MFPRWKATARVNIRSYQCYVAGRGCAALFALCGKPVAAGCILSRRTASASCIAAQLLSTALVRLYHQLLTEATQQGRRSESSEGRTAKSFAYVAKKPSSASLFASLPRSRVFMPILAASSSSRILCSERSIQLLRQYGPGSERKRKTD